MNNPVAVALNDPQLRPIVTGRSLFAWEQWYEAGTYQHGQPGVALPAPFHADWMDALDAGKNVVIVGARDSGKTVHARSHVLRAVCQRRKRFGIWMCAELEDATTKLTDISGQLEKNQRILRDYGFLYKRAKREEQDELDGGKLRQRDFVTTNGVRVLASSIGTSVRGQQWQDRNAATHRPDLIVIDDVDIAKMATKEGIDKAYRFITGEVLGGAAQDCQIIILGNVILDDGVAQRFYREKKGQPGWATFWQPILSKDDEILWPARFVHTNREAVRPELVSLEAKLANQGTVAFNQNFRLIPYRGTESVIRAQDLRFASQNFEPGMGWVAISLGVDPAISTKSLSDPFAMVVSAKRPDGRVDILEAVELRGDDKTTENAVFEAERLYRYWSCDRAAFEDIGFQKMLGQRLAERGMAVEYVRPMRDKAARLMEHQAKFESGVVSFNPDPAKGCAALIDQVKNFPSVAHDDLVDAMVYAMGALDSGGKMLLIPQD